jgi:hypothetical protein
MPTGTLHTWITRHIAVRRRLERICTGYLLFLMVATTKHSLTEAARFSGLHPSLFSKLLQSHTQVAITLGSGPLRVKPPPLGLIVRQSRTQAGLEPWSPTAPDSPIAGPASRSNRSPGQ